MAMTSQRGKINLCDKLNQSYQNSVVQTNVNVLAMSPTRSGAYTAEKITIAGICNKQTCKAYAEPISILIRIDQISLLILAESSDLRDIFPFKANEIAFINSVVLGTNAKSVTPRNFSSIPEPLRTTSTTSTKISVRVQ